MLGTWIQVNSVSHLDEQGYASSCKSSKSRGAKDNCEEEEEVGGDQDQDQDQDQIKERNILHL